MALSTQQGSYRQFSVIARLRQGVVSPLSTYGTILEIQKHLSSYKCICNVAFLPPNYVIHLPEPELQVQILSLKTFTGPGYILDIMPWCYEYISFDLPWIITRANENTQKQMHTVSAAMKSADADTMPQLKKTKSSSTATRARGARQGAPGCSTTAGSSLLQCSDDGDKGSVYNCVPINLSTLEQSGHSEILVDFSYLVIAELKMFYYEKFRGFQKCSSTCKRIYDTVLNFYDEIERAVKAIYVQESAVTTPPETVLDHSMVPSADLNNMLWVISEEMFGLQISMKSIYGSMVQPIDLATFSANPVPNQVAEPVVAAANLRTIADSVVSQIYDRTLLIATDEDLTGTTWTQVWCSYFHHKYKSVEGAAKEQTEANAVYRFLKYVTNVLGYTIKDSNCSTLCRVVADINHLNGSITDLQLCVDRATSMINDANKAITPMFISGPSQLSQQETPYANVHVQNLMTLLQHYQSAMQTCYETFQQEKQAFRSVKFQTIYPAKSD